MNRKQYTFSFDDTRKFEKLARNFLLNNSDVMRLTLTPYWEWSSLFRFKKFGTLDDPKVKKFLITMRNDFIKKQTLQNGRKKTEYFYFKLSNKIKQLINKETLVWNVSPACDSFYGFENPTFYKKKEIIGEIISHEPIIFLFLTQREKSTIEKKGIEFCNIA